MKNKKPGLTAPWDPNPNVIMKLGINSCSSWHSLKVLLLLGSAHSGLICHGYKKHGCMLCSFYKVHFSYCCPRSGVDNGTHFAKICHLSRVSFCANICSYDIQLPTYNLQFAQLNTFYHKFERLSSFL